MKINSLTTVSDLDKLLCTFQNFGKQIKKQDTKHLAAQNSPRARKTF